MITEAEYQSLKDRLVADGFKCDAKKKEDPGE
jgi:hypothetical protein